MARALEELTPRELRERDAAVEETRMRMAIGAVQDIAEFIDWQKITYAVCYRMLGVYAKSYGANIKVLQTHFDALFRVGMVPPQPEHIMANRMAAAVKEMEDLSDYIDWKRCDDVHLNMFIAAVAALHGVSREELGNRYESTF